MKPKNVSVSTSELVILAIHGLEEKNPEEQGFTQNEVAQFLLDKYHLDPKSIKQSIQDALLRGARFGIFAQKANRFKLEALPEVPSKSPGGKESRGKLETLVVEVSHEKVRRKRKKRSEEDMRQWTFDGEDDWKNYYSQLAKRKKSSKDVEKKSDDEDDDEDEDDDQNMAGISKRFI